MAKGKIKWYNEIKGFGFIVSDEGEDLFLHRSSLLNSNLALQPGDNVEFEIRQSDKGLVARKVSLSY
jgi:CspA family cold shock protein